MKMSYVHGYSEKENQRLQDQASTLTELLHADSLFPPGSRVLEAGCGVGSQTLTLSGQNPAASFTSVDISELSLEQARRRLQAAGLNNVEFQQADIYRLPFAAASFDHVFLCFVLEHLRDPLAAIISLEKVLKPGGSITVIEGDHGSAYFYPDSEEAHQAIQCQIKLQAALGGNALIGRELYPLLRKSGFAGIRVSPRMVYVDAGKPELVDGFIRKTFTAMIEGVREQAIKENLIDPTIFDQGIRDLYRTADLGGTFCYTFFKAIGVK
ncbi:MAG: methyltransferase domain-containing protein [Deltaproteobacteria bacterium]|nr:MAG: methyltransferase domain-containing protein [Deltaproteobacteria bacterium]